MVGDKLKRVLNILKKCHRLFSDYRFKKKICREYKWDERCGYVEYYWNVVLTSQMKNDDDH